MKTMEKNNGKFESIIRIEIFTWKFSCHVDFSVIYLPIFLNFEH